MFRRRPERDCAADEGLPWGPGAGMGWGPLASGGGCEVVWKVLDTGPGATQEKSHSQTGVRAAGLGRPPPRRVERPPDRLLVASWLFFQKNALLALIALGPEHV